MRVAIKFAYDGKEFNGYARQPNLKTVEGELIKSLAKHEIIENAKKYSLNAKGPDGFFRFEGAILIKDNSVKRPLALDAVEYKI